MTDDDKARLIAAFFGPAVPFVSLQDRAEIASRFAMRDAIAKCP
jgi:hypothetical protein